MVRMGVQRGSRQRVPCTLGYNTAIPTPLQPEYPLVQAEVVDTHPTRIQFRNVLTAEAETSSETRQQFLEAFKVFQFEVDHNPHDPRALPSTIWDLDLAHDGELSDQICIPDASRHGHVFRSFEDGTPAVSATITPAGTITEPHIDQTGSGTLLIQLLGRKVFVIWPPRPNNLEWFANKYGIRCGTIFEAALQRLEFPQCIIFEQGQYEVLGVGYIHGVLYPINSAVSGVPVVHSSLRSDADVEMQWERVVVARRSAGTTVEKVTLKTLSVLCRRMEHYGESLT